MDAVIDAVIDMANDALIDASRPCARQAAASRDLELQPFKGRIR